MSTPSPRRLSFNAAPLSLYRQLLSIKQWLGKMASAASEEPLLCSSLILPLRVRGGRRLIVGRRVARQDITPLATHRGVVMTCSGGGGRVAQSSSCTSCPSCTWVALSIPIISLDFYSFKTTVASTHSLFLSAAELPQLRSPSLWVFFFFFNCGFTPSLWKFTAWLGGKERKIKLLKAGLDHRWNPPKRKRKERKIWCKFRRHIAWRRGRELKECFSIPGIVLKIGLLISYCLCYHIRDNVIFPQLFGYPRWRTCNYK